MKRNPTDDIQSSAGYSHVAAFVVNGKFSGCVFQRTGIVQSVAAINLEYPLSPYLSQMYPRSIILLSLVKIGQFGSYENFMNCSEGGYVATDRYANYTA